MTFFPNLSSVNKSYEQESNPMSWPVYLNLSGSAFLVSFTDPNNQLTNMKSMSEFFNCGFSV